MDPAAILGSAAALLTDPLRIGAALAVGWFWAPAFPSLGAAIVVSIGIALLFGPLTAKILVSASIAGAVLWLCARALRRLTHRTER